MRALDRGPGIGAADRVLAARSTLVPGSRGACALGTAGGGTACSVPKGCTVLGVGVGRQVQGGMR
jgi:hypothetical protein